MSRVKTMIKLRYLTLQALWLVMISSCSDKSGIGKAPMIDIDFEEVETSLINESTVSISYTHGLNGKGLNLDKSTGIALANPGTDWLSIEKDFSLVFWVKLEQTSQDTTIILSNADFRTQDMGIYGKRRTRKGLTIYSVNGGWAWNIGNGQLYYNYEPVPEDQSLNDRRWHQLAFTFRADRKEARLYFDGVNRAGFSLGDLKKSDFKTALSLTLGQNKDTPQYKSFPGAIDELKIWNTSLTADEIKQLYERYAAPVREPQFDKEELTVLNWNIWHGGTHYTKEKDGFDGIGRIIDMIEQSGADIVLMQETYGAGSKISSSLGYYYYEASSTIGAVWGANLSVMSRYPIEDMYMLEVPSNYGKNYAFNNGGARIKLSEDKGILAFTNWYNGGKPEDLAGALTGWKNLIDSAEYTPVIWAGDFNSVSHLDDGQGESGHSKLMTDAGFIDSYRQLYPDAEKYPGYTAPRFEDRIDYIYYTGSGLELIEAGNIAKSFQGKDKLPGYPSDHLGITAKFKVK